MSDSGCRIAGGLRRGRVARSLFGNLLESGPSRGSDPAGLGRSLRGAGKGPGRSRDRSRPGEPGGRARAFCSARSRTMGFSAKKTGRRPSAKTAIAGSSTRSTARPTTCTGSHNSAFRSPWSTTARRSSAAFTTRWPTNAFTRLAGAGAFVNEQAAPGQRRARACRRRSWR